MDECAVWGRSGPDLPTERHHLVPVNRAWICRWQGMQTAATGDFVRFSNEELRESFRTGEDLRGAVRVQDYLSWIRGTKKTEIKVETSDLGREQR